MTNAESLKQDPPSPAASGPFAGVVCAKARTSLLVPFSVPKNVTDREWLDGMLERKLPRPSDDETKEDSVWTWKVKRPEEFLELHPAFRRAISAASNPSARGEVEAELDERATRGVWLTFESEIRKRFQDMRFVVTAGGTTTLRAVKLTGVHVAKFGARSGVLLVEVEFDENCGASEVVETLFCIRHLQSERGTEGVVFGPGGSSEATDGDSRFSAAYKAALGSDLASAFRGGGESDAKPTALGVFLNWLLLLPTEPATRLDIARHRKAEKHGELLPSQAKIGISRYALPHTTVLLAKDPGAGVAHKLCVFLRRAYRLDYAIPNRFKSSDIELRPRSNRLIGVSREGVASLSWPADGLNETFENDQWLPKFDGIYRCLHIHALSERAQLARFGASLAEFGSRIERTEQGPHAHAYGSRNDEREELDREIRTVVSQILQLTGEDCGGLTEYRDFYSAVRTAHGLTPMLAESRQELRELAEVVHGASRLAAEKRQLRADRRADTEQKRINDLTVAVGVLGALALPFAIAQGLSVLVPSYFGATAMTPGKGVATFLALLVVVVVLLKWLLPRSTSTTPDE